MLEEVTHYKYLGVHITADLSWQTYVTYIVNNANQMPEYLRRSFSFVLSSLMLLLCNMQARSKFEYACAVWDPSYILS